MCPLYPLHIIISWSLLFFLVWLCGGQSLASAVKWNSSVNVRFLLEGNSSLRSIDLTEGENKSVIFYVDDLPPDAIGEIIFKEESEDGLSHIDIAPDVFPLQYDSASGNSEPQNITVSGLFLGLSKIKLKLSAGEDDQELMEHKQEIRVKVYREAKTLDTIFIVVVIALVMIVYINMGCAINLDVIKNNIKRPLSPAIGLASQYIFMPLASYGLGYALFSSRPDLWLGLFLTGCAPAGGGSNMWTYILGGSLDLSITMTFLSTVSAFATLPLWIWALAPSIFADGYYEKLPYKNIAFLVLGLVVPCCMGLCIRRYSPKAADFLKKTLKPLSLVFILFVLTFGVYAKFYLFSFFTWKVALAGFCLPFFGFTFGGVLAVLLKRKWEDVIAISIETGIQNTGLAVGVIEIALANFSPLEDIAIVLPVAVATMTPIPLLICYITKYFKNRREPQKLISDENHPNYQIASTTSLMENPKAVSNGNLA